MRWTTPSFQARFKSVSHLSGSKDLNGSKETDNSNPDSSEATGRLVLVVDDEPDVLRLLQSILAEEGYEVIGARSAEVAIKTFEGLPRRPDLLLVDVVMPGMSGPMLVDHLRQIDPDLNVLFMSGYDDRHVVQRYVVDKGFHLISKPFTVKSLRLAIQEVIKDSESARRGEPAR
jgi:two-component system cell cycle sensor histidine kinase/response regulator CckA